MKRVFLLLTIFLSLTVNSLATTFPDWTYAIDPLVLEDVHDFLVLTSKETLLDISYVPQDLVKVNVRATSSGMELRQDAALALERMFQAAEDDGYKLYLKSAYRSYQTQKTMYENRLEKYSRDDGVVAYPGSSDHQTGLAADILNYAWTQQDGMRPEFSQTQEAQWMAENCHKFGFILRYMEDKQEITGIIFEPWHFRYVGLECAEYIMANHLALEEFTRESQQAIATFEQLGGDFKLYCEELKRLPPPVELDDEEDGEVSLFYTSS